MQLFPSITSGYQKFHFINNDKLSNGVSCRYYNNSTFKNLLISAGHNYRFNNFRKDLGASTAVVLGDSGGYQLISNALEYTNLIEDRGIILNWLENNCDIGVNLDISPSIKDMTFNEALKLSYDNFKYFHENQTGKIKLLNVIHGENKKELKKWYNKVKCFDFYGWAVGSIKINNLLDALDIIENSAHIHLLGIYDFEFIRTVSNLSKKYDLNITYDTSLPSRLASENILITQDMELQKVSDKTYLDILIGNIEQMSSL